MTRRVKSYHHGDIERVQIALTGLRYALHHLKLAGCPKTADRVRRAISSAKGALRNVETREQHAYHEQRRAEEASDRERVLVTTEERKP